MPTGLARGIERLLLQIACLQRNRFGRRSERLDEETLQQGMEDLEQSLGEQEAGLEAAAASPEGSEPRTSASEAPPRPRTEPPKRNRGALPVHLARDEVVVDVEDKTCPCCKGTLHLIGEDRSEMLDFVPAHVRVRVIRRPKYGCRACGEAVVQAPAPERPIDGGMATEALLAHVLVSKYADHLPLYRQSQTLGSSPCACLGPPGHRAGSFHARQLGRPRLLVAGPAARTAPEHRVGLAQGVRRRYALARARPWPGTYQACPCGGGGPGRFGATRSITARGADPFIRPPPICIVRTGRVSVRPLT
jgi:transposase